jgi:hypothetical protein
MKRKRILRSSDAYPRVTRSSRYYADMDQISHDAAVAKERRMREAAAGADQTNESPEKDSNEGEAA